MRAQLPRSAAAPQHLRACRALWACEAPSLIPVRRPNHVTACPPHHVLTHVSYRASSNFKMEYLTKAPTSEEIEKQRKEAAENAAGAKTDNPLAA